MADKTRRYSEDGGVTEKTEVYDSEPRKTRTYGTQPSAKTSRYEEEQMRLTDKTQAHHLGVGDSVELKGQKYGILEIVTQERQTAEAVIYKIENNEGKVFGLKLYYRFHNSKDEPNPEALARIKDINDPDILKLHDFGTGANKFLGKFCFEICDFAEGLTLLAVPDLKKKYTVEFLRSNVIPEIFKGIRTLHDHKIYHCDLKPENIFYLDKEKTDLIIGDYGSAKTFEQFSEKQLTHTSSTKGTSFYLAPEQPRGIVSEKNDYYSFGMVLLHLVYPELVNRTSLHKIIERQFSKKPIADFDLAYGEVNDLIAGLTLSDFDSRWGENEVKAWLRGESVEVNYELQVRVQPINLGKVVIQSEKELIGHIENNKDWYENLIEDKEGYNLLLRWVSDLQGLDKKKIFDRMVRTYQQDGRDFVEQAVLRYFMPQRPIQVDMKVYDFWKSKNVAQQTIGFIKHLDDIWKITPLEKMKFYMFQLEFVLRQIQSVLQGKQQALITSLLDKIASVLSVPLKASFDGYSCIIYPKLNDSKLLGLFYAFDKKRTFKDLENRQYNTIEDIGYLFARQKYLYDNEYIKIEKEKLLELNRLSDYNNLSYENFLFSVFNENIKSQIKILDVLFETQNEKEVQLKYKFGKSLKSYFHNVSIDNDLSQFDRGESILLKRGFLPLPQKLFHEFLIEIQKKHDVRINSIDERSSKDVQSSIHKYCSKFFKLSIRKVVVSTIGVVFFLLPLLTLIALVLPDKNEMIINTLLSITPLNVDFSRSIFDVVGVFAPNIYGVNILLFILFIPATTFYFLKNPKEEIFNNSFNLKYIFIVLGLFLILGPAIIFIINICIYIILIIPVWVISASYKWTADEAIQNINYPINIILYFIPAIVLFFSPIIKFFQQWDDDKYYLKNFSIVLSAVFFICIISIMIHLGENNIKKANIDKLSFKKTTTNKQSSERQKRINTKEIEKEKGIIETEIPETNKKPEKIILKDSGVIGVNSANIRSGPSTQNKIITTLPKNKEIKIISKHGNWYLIRFDSVNGYIYSKLVNRNLQSKRSIVQNTDAEQTALDRLKKKVEETEPAGGAQTIEARKNIEAIKIYQAEIQYQIQKNWSFSQQLSGDGYGRETILAIKIMRNGEIAEIWFDKKSGNSYLDESAHKAIVKSNPLPPLPKIYKGSFYKIGFIFGPKGLK